MVTWWECYLHLLFVVVLRDSEDPCTLQGSLRASKDGIPPSSPEKAQEGRIPLIGPVVGSS
jgi:hypothetical protein